MDRQHTIRRLMALGDIEAKANHLFDYYKDHDDLEILLRTIDLRESTKLEPVDKRFYHSY